jgi:hypothetical protein
MRRGETGEWDIHTDRHIFFYSKEETESRHLHMQMLAAAGLLDDQR